MDSKQVLTTRTLIIQYVLIAAVQIWNIFFPDHQIGTVVQGLAQLGGSLVTRLMTNQPAHLLPKP